jgi:putative membrane protein
MMQRPGVTRLTFDRHQGAPFNPPEDDHRSRKEEPMMWGMEEFGWGWVGLGILHMALFWVLVILGIVVLVKWLAGSTPRSETRAIDILKERYAKGELTRDQFEQMKRDLG